MKANKLTAVAAGALSAASLSGCHLTSEKTYTAGNLAVESTGTTQTTMFASVPQALDQIGPIDIAVRDLDGNVRTGVMTFIIDQQKFQSAENLRNIFGASGRHPIGQGTLPGLASQFVAIQQFDQQPSETRLANLWRFWDGMEQSVLTYGPDRDFRNVIAYKIYAVEIVQNFGNYGYGGTITSNYVDQRIHANITSHDLRHIALDVCRHQKNLFSQMFIQVADQNVQDYLQQTEVAPPAVQPEQPAPVIEPPPEENGIPSVNARGIAFKVRHR
ncbi:MAG: hypothetical protein AB7U41_01420 [Dongiaceae bacterium]